MAVRFCVLASDLLCTPISIESIFACFRYVLPARLFLDSEPEVKTQPLRKRLALDSAKNNCYTVVPDGKNLIVPEFLAVGRTYPAIFLCAVKGGVLFSAHDLPHIQIR